jgi:D-arabinose 1-dehydrogenase-like Zn-dependent alcohol dehydrogenase
MLGSKSAEILGYTNLSLTWTEHVSALEEVLSIAASGALDVTTQLVGPASLPGAWRGYANGDLRGRVVVDFAG